MKKKIKTAIKKWKPEHSQSRLYKVILQKIFKFLPEIQNGAYCGTI